MKILRVGCIIGGFLSLALSLSSQTFTTLHSFEGPRRLQPRAPAMTGDKSQLHSSAFPEGI
jgi:hypothetical protein